MTLVPLRRRGYRFRIYLFAALMVLLVVVGSALTITVAWHSREVATLIVGKDFRAREIERSLIDLVLSMEYNRKHYTVLEKPEYREAFYRDATDFKEKLGVLASLGLSYPEQESIAALEQDLGAYLEEDPFRPGGYPAENEEITNAFLDRLRTLLTLNQEQIDSQIAEVGNMEQKTVRLSSLWAVFSVLLGGLLSVLLIRSITRPLGLLQKGTREIAEGRFSHRVYLPTRDELGRLANAFNEMAYQLEKLDEMKSDFMAIVSHELKTPLTSMTEAVELLRDETAGALSAKQRHLLDIAAQGIERLATLIDEILNLTKFEAGMIDINRTWCHYPSLVKEKIRIFELLAHKKRIRIETSFEPAEMPAIYADPEKLNQVLGNLLSNAIRFTPYGGNVSVRARYRTDTSAGSPTQWLEVRVSDSGEGIPREEWKKVFEKFYQIQDTSNRGGGSGLGLTISKHIVEAHGGSIWIEESSEKGTTFVFRLPQDPQRLEQQPDQVVSPAREPLPAAF